jgi:hypothetical protein
MVRFLTRARKSISSNEPETKGLKQAFRGDPKKIGEQSAFLLFPAPETAKKNKKNGTPLISPPSRPALGTVIFLFPLRSPAGRTSTSSGVTRWRANAWFVAGPMWRLGLDGSGDGGEENRDVTRLPERSGQADCSSYFRTSGYDFGEHCRYNHPHDRGGTEVSVCPPAPPPLSRDIDGMAAAATETYCDGFFGCSFTFGLERFERAPTFGTRLEGILEPFFLQSGFQILR